MAKKSRFLKKILTTASAAAVFVGSGQVVYGAIPNLIQNSAGTVATLKDGETHNTVNSDNNAAHFVNNNIFAYQDAQNLIIDGAKVTAIDVNGKNLTGKTITSSGVVSLRAVVDVAGGGTKADNIIVQNGGNLTLSGNAVTGTVLPLETIGKKNVTLANYSAMGALTLNNTSILTIADEAKNGFELAAGTKINGIADDDGIINIGNGTYTINDTIGDTHVIGSLDVGASNTTFKGEVKANTIYIGNASVAENAAIFKGKVTAANGITFKANGAYTEHYDDVTGAYDFAGSDSEIDVYGGKKITGAINNSVAGAAKGIVYFDDGGEITGRVGKTARIKTLSVNKGVVKMSAAGGAGAPVVHGIENIEIQDGATLEISGDDVKLNVTNVAGGSNTATLLFSALRGGLNDGAIIGKADQAIRVVTAADASVGGAGDATSIPGGTHHADFSFNHARAGFVFNNGAVINGTIVPDVGGVQDNRGVIHAKGDVKINANIGTDDAHRLRLVEVLDNSVLQLAAGQSYFSGGFFVGNNATLKVGPGGILNTKDGNIYGGVNSTLEFENGGGIVGVTGHISSITVIRILDGTVSIDDMLSADNIVNRLELQGQTSSIRVLKTCGLLGNIINTSGTDNSGTVRVEADGVRLYGVVGGVGQALKSLEIAQGELVLSGNHHYIQNVSLQSDTSSLLMENGGTLHGNATTNTNGKGELRFAINGSIIGSAGEESKRLAKLSAGGAGVVNLINPSTGDISYYYFNAIELANGSQIVGYDKVSLFGNATNAAGGGAIINFQRNGFFTGNTSNTVTTQLTGSGTVEVSGNIEGKIELKHLNAVLSLVSGSTADIDADTDGHGKVYISGNVETKGNLGKTKKIGSIMLTPSVAYTIDTLDAGEINTNGIVFTKGSKLVLKSTHAGNATRTLVNAPIVINNTTPLGELVLVGHNNDMKTTLGRIGDISEQALKSLVVENGAGAVVIENKVNIANVSFGGTSLEFKATSRIGGVQLISGAAELKISEDIELLSRTDGLAANLGSADGQRFAKITLMDKTLTIGDKVNIYASGTLEPDTGDEGILVFKGNAILDSKSIGADANKIKQIQATGGADTTVTLTGNIHTHEDISVGSGALELAGTEITSDADIVSSGGGTLRFINTAPAKITANNIKGFNVVELSGNNLEFSPAAGIEFKSLQFNVTGPIRTASFNNAIAGAGKMQIINKTHTQHVIVMDGDVTFETPVTDPVDIKMGVTAAKTATINTNLSGVRFLKFGANKATIDFTLASGGTIAAAGTAGTNVDEVIFTEDGTILGETHADEVTVADNKTANVGNVFDSTKTTLGVNSTISFGSGIQFDGSNITNVATSKLEFRGRATLTTEMGSTEYGSISFTGSVSDIVDVQTNMDAGIIDFGQSTIRPNSGIVFTAPNIKLTNIDTGGAANQIEFTDGTPAENGILSLVGDTLITVTAVTKDATYRITTDKLDVTKMTSLGVAVRDGSIEMEDIRSGNVVINVLKSSDMIGKYSNAVSVVGQEFEFIGWTGSLDDNGNLILRAFDNTEGVLREDTKNASSNVRDNLDAVLNNEAIVKLFSELDPENRPKLIEKLVPVTKANIEAIAEATGAASGSVMNHMSQFGAGMANFETPLSVAPAAGDDESFKYGAWLSPVFGNVSQNAKRGASGYDSTVFGGTLGFDAKINTDLALGLAVSLINSNVKHKNFKDGDKTQIDSVMFSIYGMQQFTDSWFLEGVATVGTNNVTTKERRIVSNNMFETANGKYHSTSFGGEALFGYSFVTDSYAIIPMLGAKYTRITDGGYKETGTTVQNLSISRKASNKFDAVVGAKVAGGVFSMAQLHIVPEIRAFVMYDVIGKTPKSDIRMNGTDRPLVGNDSKPNRFFWNIGVGANMDIGYMSYGINYDFIKSTKYVANQGSLKLRINF